MHNILMALALSLLAGLATAIGGIIAVTTVPSSKTLAVSIAFAVGVMLYVSLVDIMPEAQRYLADYSSMTVVLFYCIGIAIMAIIQHAIPEPQHTLSAEGNRQPSVGIATAIAIALHNIPEGMATFVTATEGISVALPLLLAIALHNIPEGIAVSAPIYSDTGSKTTALLTSLWCGLAEPLGALLACWLLLPYLSQSVLGGCFAVVAGIMTYMSVNLLPTAYRRHPCLASAGILAGMITMAISLALLR